MMNKRSKLIAAAATATLAVGALAGCSGGTGGDDGKVTITWWHNGTGEPLLSFWEGVAADFEKEHPNVTVKVEAYQNEELQRTLIPNALRSGSGVDLFQQWGAGELAAQVEAGYVMDITDQVGAEVDAIGGQMGVTTDYALTHIRRVGTGRGPAVQTIRAHVCKDLYPQLMRQTLERQANLTLIEGIVAEIDDVVVNGSREARLPGNAHFTFRGCEGDSLLMLLDANGIECSTGSACTAGVAQPSHVLIAMGADAATARGSIRLSLGHTSVDSDVDAALEVLPAAVARARQAALAAAGQVR